MDSKIFNKELPMRSVRVTDAFWKGEMELVRTEVIPYQWEALNDRVEDAPPSYCMRNFRVAQKMNREKREQGEAYEEPRYIFRGFEAKPEDPQHLKNEFYGFVFQDSDFSKWIEAAAYSLTQHADAELERVADEAIELVCAAQQEDGYLDTYYIINGRDKTFSNLRDHHELYCFGHLTEGAVAYYQATGKDRLLKAACRFADYIADYFGPVEGKCKGYPGHEIAEMALVRLYEATGEERYLNLSSFFIDQRGTRPYYFDLEHPENGQNRSENDQKSEQKDEQTDELRYQHLQAHLPVRRQEEAVGHAVRAVYLYSGMADLARLKQDESLYAACERLWNSIVNEKMYVTGGIGATHIGEAFSFPYDLPNDTAYSETCASIGLIFFARRMLQIRPDARYANVMERAFYNCVLAGMALDGKSFFYVNPLEVVPEACHKDERKFHVKAVRQKWFGCACCPPNLARLVSSAASYAYTESEDTLFVHLYMGSEIAKSVNGRTAEISIASDFPWDGTVQIRVRAKGTALCLALRLPDWCEKYRIEGLENAGTEEKDGYLYIRKDWNEEDLLRLSFPMLPRLIGANPKVREDVGKAAVTRGPIVYCLEEVDNGANLHLLSLDAEAEPAVADGEICGVSAKMVVWPGFRQSQTEEGGALYHTWHREKKEPVELKFIPYYMWANRSENEMQVWVRIAESESFSG
ncbi:MAG: glycoside hydrolase family 127 protein [Clostridiales bacterium]|nr:glycoside hydrolase family 127 protein [Clostridiales bacterium]